MTTTTPHHHSFTRHRLGRRMGRLGIARTTVRLMMGAAR